jgi:arabinofuranosyltransferase
VPNTYYAKLGLPLEASTLAGFGLRYLGAALAQDPITPLAIAAGVLLSPLDLRGAAAGASAALYVTYVVSIGGDFIGFRFLAPPFLIACLTLHRGARRLPDIRPNRVAAGILCMLFYGLLTPSSPVRMIRDPAIAPDVEFHFAGSRLASWRPGARFPFAPFMRVRDEAACHALHQDYFHVAIWGNGLNGFCRGANAHLIDPVGVSDPLIARLTPSRGDRFVPGHAIRSVPAGYIESILTGRNLIVDPELAGYYANLRLVVSGPLLARERWRHVWALNVGAERRYSRPYLAIPQPIPGWMRKEAGRRPFVPGPVGIGAMSEPLKPQGD